MITNKLNPAELFAAYLEGAEVKSFHTAKERSAVMTQLALELSEARKKAGTTAARRTAASAAGANSPAALLQSHVDDPAKKVGFLAGAKVAEAFRLGFAELGEIRAAKAAKSRAAGKVQESANAGGNSPKQQAESESRPQKAQTPTPRASWDPPESPTLTLQQFNKLGDEAKQDFARSGGRITEMYEGRPLRGSEKTTVAFKLRKLRETAASAQQDPAVSSQATPSPLDSHAFGKLSDGEKLAFAQQGGQVLDPATGRPLTGRQKTTLSYELQTLRRRTNRR